VTGTHGQVCNSKVEELLSGTCVVPFPEEYSYLCEVSIQGRAKRTFKQMLHNE
jgi:hypothetical protein